MIKKEGGWDMQTESEMGAVIAYLDGDSIENAGFDSSKMTSEQFSLIRMRVEKYVDQGWQDIVGSACEGILPPLED
jgi:hypothetical protein